MSAKKLKVIVTGATGMVGEGVLHECLMHPHVSEVLLVSRRTLNLKHEKLTELLVPDFFDLSAIATELTDYDACFFCLGVSSVGMKEAEYRRTTYDLTMAFAELLCLQNPDMIFNYITGSGTDSSERGKSMWARVKGKTENDLLRLPFRKAYMFRPGYIHPTPGLNNVHRYYRALSWMYPLLKLLFPGNTVTLREVGLAMIHTATRGYDSSILSCSDIKKLARAE
ncbi:NAD-dependent epimerase/dehydratase family protein [Paenibacillus sp. HB172176]|uniref:NAD-dependent epimerase/dehydratase family protein n=1 Tax=Paenibacillus sp. HB172176 TaxID=2493690 RepID=UPI0014395441|nr:NAD-dependent epimerase/dehydratase family protein [Paenibacillus sp. HB172176]